MITISSTDDTAFKALGQFLQSILPTGVGVFQTQINRVPESKSPDFVMMTIVNRTRLSTNIDTTADVAFTASIAATIMTVTAVAYGTLGVGNQVFGTGVADNTSIVAQVSGPSGGTGAYTITPTQTAVSQPMAAGLMGYMQPTRLSIQLDVHGPNSGANAQKISTLFRDDFACLFFAAHFPDFAPLLADDPKQLPFLNEQQQIETRYVIEAQMQANITITAPQQFAAALALDLLEVDATYPPEGDS